MYAQGSATGHGALEDRAPSGYGLPIASSRRSRGQACALPIALTIEPTVHIVDDDSSCLLALSRFLRARGFRVETYSSAMAFLGARRRDEPGCVIVELRMPEVDGLDLQRALGHMLDPLPVLFLTGHPDIASVVRAMRGGAEDFLEKSTEKEILLEAVRRALAHDQQAREERIQRQPCGSCSTPSARESARCSATSCAAA